MNAIFLILIGITFYLMVFLKSNLIVNIFTIITMIAYDVSKSDKSSFFWPKVALVFYILMILLLALGFENFAEKAAIFAYLIIVYWTAKTVILNVKLKKASK